MGGPTEDVHLGPETRHGRLEQVFRVAHPKLDHVGRLVELLDRDLARLLETVGDSDGVDSPVEQRLGRTEERSGQDDDTGRSVSDLLVLRLADLDEQLGDLVLNLHVLQDRGAVVGNGDVAVGGDEDLVETWTRQEG